MFSTFSYKVAPEGENFAPALACIDIVLKSRFRNTVALPFVRNYFFPPSAGRVALNPGMELWRGLYQSTVLGMSSLFLNADVLNKAVPSEMTVLRYFQQLTRAQVPLIKLEPYQCHIAEEHLKGLKLIYEHKESKGPKQKIPSGLGDSARVQTFRLDNGTTMTVEKYFQSLGIQLKFPLLPTIRITIIPKTDTEKKDSKSSKDLPRARNIFLPVEFCTIPGGQLNQKKCTEQCLQFMIKETAKPTNERKAMIYDICRRFPLLDQKKHFGIEIAEEFAKIMARIISSPVIKYAGGKTDINYANASWKEGNLIDPSQKVTKFAIVSCENVSMQILIDLKKDIIKAAYARKMQIEGPNDNIFTTNLLLTLY